MNKNYVERLLEELEDCMVDKGVAIHVIEGLQSEWVDADVEYAHALSVKGCIPSVEEFAYVERCLATIRKYTGLLYGFKLI